MWRRRATTPSTTLATPHPRRVPSKKGLQMASTHATIESAPEAAPLDNVSTQDLYRELLTRIGEDPTRNGLLRTPERMEKSMAFLTRGYAMDVTDVLHDALVVVHVEESIVEDISHVHRVSARKKRHGLLHALRRAKQTVACGVFPDACKQFAV